MESKGYEIFDAMNQEIKDSIDSTASLTGKAERDEDVLLSEELFRRFEGARAEWATQAAEDDEFRNGIQWTVEQEAELALREQSPIVVNIIYPTTEQGKALLTANSPRFSSTGREDSDTKTGKLFADLMSYIWGVSDGNTELKQVVDDYYVKGLGYLCVYFDDYADNGKGEIYVKSLDPLTVYLSPATKDRYGWDSSDIIISTIATEAEIRSRFPDLTLVDAMEEKGTETPATMNVPLMSEKIGPQTSQEVVQKTFRIIDRYRKVTVSRYHVYDTQTRSERVLDEVKYEQFLQVPAFLMQNNTGMHYITNEDDIARLLDIYEETGGIYHFAADPETGTPRLVSGSELVDPDAIPDSGVILSLITMKEMVNKGVIEVRMVKVPRIKRVYSVGGQLVSNTILPCSNYPVVAIMNRFNRNPYPLSDVRLSRKLQQYINKMRSLIVAHTASSVGLKVFVPRGAADKAEIEREIRKPGAAVIEYDGEGGRITIGQPIQLPNELYKNESDARKDIERIFGIYELMQGGGDSTPSTFRGTIALDEYGQRRIKSKRDDIESSLNQLAKVVVEYIQAYYTERKVLRLLQPNNPPKEVVINESIYDDVTGGIKGKLNDVTVGNYDLVIVSGSMLPSNRWARFDYYMELYKTGLIDQVEVLKQTEVVDMEGVLNRGSQIAQMKKALADMGQELKKISGDLQTAQRESMHDRKSLEVEKFKTKLNAQAAKVEAASGLFSARLEDELKGVKQDVADSGAPGARETPLEFAPSLEDEAVSNATLATEA